MLTKNLVYYKPIRNFFWTPCEPKGSWWLTNHKFLTLCPTAETRKKCMKIDDSWDIVKSSAVVILRTYKKRGDHPRDHLVLKLIFMRCSGEATYVSISDLYIRVSKVVVHHEKLLEGICKWVNSLPIHIYSIATIYFELLQYGPQ